jgi:hypothetical protein
VFVKNVLYHVTRLASLATEQRAPGAKNGLSRSWATEKDNALIIGCRNATTSGKRAAILCQKWSTGVLKVASQCGGVVGEADQAAGTLKTEATGAKSGLAGKERRLQNKFRTLTT